MCSYGSNQQYSSIGSGNKPSSGPMMGTLLTHMRVTRLQWDKQNMTAFLFGTLFHHFRYHGENTYNCLKIFILFLNGIIAHLGYVCFTATPLWNILSNSLCSVYNPLQIEKETVTVLWTLDGKCHRKQVPYFIYLELSSTKATLKIVFSMIPMRLYAI